LLDNSATIFGEPATKQDTAYLPRELVQVHRPHKNPGHVPVWTRSNGNLTVGIQARSNERPIFFSISGQSENAAAQETRNSAENGACACARR
jgi:hypothetical protein